MAEVWDVQQLKLTWETRKNAPCAMWRGAAVAHGSVGYFSSEYSHDVFAYDSEKNAWSKLPECPQKDFGLAVINNLLTAAGGRSARPTNYLVSFNGSKWDTIFPPMPTKRQLPVVISAQNYLIAAGGVGVGRVLSTVEVMNTDTREWYTAASLPEPVSEMSATVCGGRLYLLGGWDKSNNPIHAVFTCTLDSLLHSCHPPSQTPPHTNEAGVWQHIADVPMGLSTCTTLNGRVLAVGGEDSHGTHTDNVYMYHASADSDSWQLVGHMSTAQSSCLVVGLRDCIIAVGGLESSSVEVGYLQLSATRSSSDVTNVWDPGKYVSKQQTVRSEDLIHEFEVLTTDQDGLLGVLEATLQEYGDEANYEAKKLLCALFQDCYDNCKEAVIHHMSVQLYKHFAVHSKKTGEMEELSRGYGLLLSACGLKTEEMRDEYSTEIKKKSKKTEELEQLSRGYGLLLSASGLKTEEMRDEYSTEIKKKMYGEILSPKSCQKVKESLRSHEDHLGKAIALAWKFVTLPNPLIVCQPKKFDPQIHDPELGHWDSECKDEIIYTRPVVYRNYKGALACEGWVANTT